MHMPEGIIPVSVLTARVRTTFSVLSQCEEVLETQAKVPADVQVPTFKAAETKVSGDVPSAAVSTPTEAPMEWDRVPIVEAVVVSTPDSDL